MPLPLARRALRWRSVGLRFALLYTAAFMVSVGAIGWLTVRTVSEALERQTQRQTENEAGALVDEFNDGGRPDLEAALAGRFANRLVHMRYALIEADGRVSLGDASLLPHGRGNGPVGAASPGGGPSTAVRLLGDGSRVVVADDLVGVREIEAVLRRAFLVALATAAGLGLLTGFLHSATLLRHLDSITRTAEAVVEGDLTRRITQTGSGDEFDRLAATLNRMLDRIGSLLDNLRQVSTDIAHDLRTPLSRLRQGLEMAGRNPTIDAYRRAVDQAIEETDGILDIFSALLRIAQIEARVRQAAFRPLDLSALLLSVGETYLVAAADGGRSFETDIAAGVRVQGDRDLLLQLVVNLIENALQHTPPGSTIRLGLAMLDGRPEIAVRDDGPGIPSSERDNVFRRFYRLERSRTGPGSGLGLSLVAAIADLHGCQVTLADGKPGLRVSVTFPSRDDATAAADGAGTS